MSLDSRVVGGELSAASIYSTMVGHRCSCISSSSSSSSMITFVICPSPQALFEEWATAIEYCTIKEFIPLLCPTYI